MYSDSWLDLLTTLALKGKMFDHNVAVLFEAMVVSNHQACSLLRNIKLSRLQVYGETNCNTSIQSFMCPCIPVHCATYATL